MRDNRPAVKSKIPKEITPMVTRTPRFLLALASLLSAVGGALHAAAFRKALTAIAASNLPRFYGGSSKGLWLADSATLFILAAVFGLIAARPSSATKQVVVLVALIPAACWRSRLLHFSAQCSYRALPSPAHLIKPP